MCLCFPSLYVSPLVMIVIQTYSIGAMNNFLWMKGTYRDPKTPKWEGYNLLWMLVKTNAALFTASEFTQLRAHREHTVVS